MLLEGCPYRYTVVIWLEIQPCIMIAKAVHCAHHICHIIVLWLFYQRNYTIASHINTCSKKPILWITIMFQTHGRNINLKWLFSWITLPPHSFKYNKTIIFNKGPFIIVLIFLSSIYRLLERVVLRTLAARMYWFHLSVWLLYSPWLMPGPNEIQLCSSRRHWDLRMFL